MTPRRGFRVSSLAYIDLERAGMKARDVLAPDVPPTRGLSGMEVFEGLDAFTVMAGGKTYPLTYGIVSRLPQGVEALTYLNRDKAAIQIDLLETTYRALERNEPRALFTVGHEIGHAVMHTSTVVDMATMPHVSAALMRGSPDHKVFADSEWQADGFAAALLMPLDGLAANDNGSLTVSMVQRQYGVSYDAARRRVQFVQSKGRAIWERLQPARRSARREEVSR